MDDEPERPLPPLTWRDVLDRVVRPDRARAVRLAGGALALLAVAAVVWWAVRPPPAPAIEESLPFAPTSVPASSGPPSTSSTTVLDELVVHAAGAVGAPGLYHLPADARVADLLALAGGPTADADLDRVNLAAGLADGERVWFARVGEAAPPAVEAGGASSAGGRGGEPAGPLDLNAATAEQLEELPGIGPSIAAAIVEHRERNGPFASVDGLLDVPGIGPARLEELRPLVTV